MANRTFSSSYSSIYAHQGSVPVGCAVGRIPDCATKGTSEATLQNEASVNDFIIPAVAIPSYTEFIPQGNERPAGGINGYCAGSHTVHGVVHVTCLSPRAWQIQGAIDQTTYSQGSLIPLLLQSGDAALVQRLRCAWRK